MKIVIPTYKRLGRQLSLQALGPVKEHVVLVVRQEELQEALEVHDHVVAITDPVHNMAETIEWIVKKGFPNQRIWICDDDLQFYNMDKDEQRKRISNTDQIVDMYNRVDKLSQEYAHGGLWQPVAPPNFAHWPGIDNSRYSTNKWYDLTKFDATTIDWTSIPAAEDFHVMLQLFKRGFDSHLLMEYYVVGAAANAEGGCSTYRTIEYHNESMRLLQKAHPEHVSLREKTQKTGPWKDQPRLAARITMKRKEESTFTNLFEE